MKIAKGSPKRPALRYYGGGWLRAEWTISHFPQHENYVEPCFGAGSILLRKPAVTLESVGDIDGRVVNFFWVLRSRADELLEKINLTPWAEQELFVCLETDADPLEDARRFFFTCWMSVQGGPVGNKSFRNQNSHLARFTTPAADAVNRDDLLITAERLRNVQIFKRDGLEMIRKYLGTGALIYFDPPYLPETRKVVGYNHEVTPAWHRLAAVILRKHNGPVVVAGYKSRLYERIYEGYGWKRVEREQQTNGGTKATECLWLNPICQDQLVAEQNAAMSHELRLFY